MIWILMLMMSRDLLGTRMFTNLKRESALTHLLVAESVVTNIVLPNGGNIIFFHKVLIYQRRRNTCQIRLEEKFTNIAVLIQV